MKIAVSAVDSTLDASLDPRLGRCPYFLVIDTETTSYDAIPNANRSAPSGARVQAAQTFANHDMKVVITGSVGPNAYHALSAARIDIITNAEGIVRDAIDQFSTGCLRRVTFGPSTSTRYGMEHRGGVGWGRGMGRGRGDGSGRQQATGQSVPPRPRQAVPSPPLGTSKERELQLLQAQAATVQQQLDQIQKRMTPIHNDERLDGGD
jgi:predicted Fe-Mo cluster-binding NifX family protein